MSLKRVCTDDICYSATDFTSKQHKSGDRLCWAYLTALGGLVPSAGLSVIVAEPGDEAVAGTESGAWAAWSLEGMGAGALTAESEDSDLEEVVPETAGLPLAAADKELLLDADSWMSSTLSTETSELLRECLRCRLLSFLSFFSSFFSSCRS